MKTQLSTAGNAEAAPPPPEVLDVLHRGDKAGPWIVERELGRGGMGTVYAVVHEEIGKRAALKVVHARLLVPGFNSDRMLLEAKVVNQVGHPNIVDIFETGRMPDGRPYIVMERLAGQPLAYRADDGKILPDQVIAILLQICDALIAAHATGIIHRDLKLDNVFLVDNPDDPATPRVKVLDWGIAKVISNDVRHTIEGQLVGTPQYLSPEQARGGAVSPQSDVYSLGVMAYELFLEQLPFEAETSAEIMAMHLRATPPPASELWPEIPPALEELLHQMLAKAPDHRPTMLEVAHRLEAVRGELRERQRRSFNGLATVATPPPGIVIPPPPPVIAPEPARHPTPHAFAPTMPAEWQTPSRRWQWAVGGLALAASAALFLLSRAGDQGTAAAAPPEHHAAANLPAVEPVTPQPVTTPPVQAAALAVAPIGDAIADAVMTTPEPSPPARVGRSSTHRPSAATSATRSTSVSSRKAPVMPRRVQIDPDGTIDPYR